MKQQLVVFACLVSSSLVGRSVDSLYLLKAIDNDTKYQVSFRLDYVKEFAKFTIQNHSLTIFEVRGIDTAIVHADSFLEVKFRVRGGTGVKVRKTILLCVVKDRLYKTLDITSEVSSRLDKVYDKRADSLKLFDEREDHLVLLSVKKRGGSYVANLDESYEKVSKYDPSQNESYAKNYELIWEPAQNIFYNSTKIVRELKRIRSSVDYEAISEKFVNMELPCITLFGGGTYLFFEGEWYSELRDNSWGQR